ncbi:M30 family zinc metallopeptidase [Cupriavidus campinensis]
MAALVLAACGGGGGDSPSSGTAAQGGTTTTTTTAPPEPLLVTGLDQACSGALCGAATSASFSGSGTGIWDRTNASAASVDMQYSLSGLAGTSVSLMLTNLSNGVALLPTSLSASQLDATTVTRLSPQALTADATAEATMREIAAFNRSGWADAVKAAQPMRQTLGVLAPHATALPAPGAQKSWYHLDKTLRPATLQKQVTATDGTVVNFWVEDSQFNVANGIDLTMVDSLAAAFAGHGQIYDMLTGVGGAVWGANAYPTTVLPTGQPVDIVILNFDNDGKGYGTVGYFWGLHNLLKTADSRSNESVSLYLDSETLALGGAAGMQAMKMTMAHEGTHMQNFYRRAVLMGPSFAYDDWLEEMTAMQMEDFLSYSIDPTYNAIRDVRFPDFYRKSSYNCPLLMFTGGSATCESYSVSGSFGGFLDRQLGLAFYKDLLTRQVASSKDALDQAIRVAQPGLTFDQALMRWAVTNGSGMPAAKAPAGYGYPLRPDSGFVLPEIDPASASNAALRKLPAVVPAFLQGLGTLPLTRTATDGVYSDKVRVPAGVALSVVAY